MTKACVKNNETFNWEALENEEHVDLLELAIEHGRISQKEAELIQTANILSDYALNGGCTDAEWNELFEKYENLRKELRK